jgi:ubiquinone/menaquinone biosynthesis C-methylase UbiE
MSDGPRYSLALSSEEVQRYRVMAALARANEAAQWEAAGIVAGARVADLGCGPGVVAIELASIVGPSGSVVAVDREPSAIEAAQRLAAEAGLANVRVVQGAASETGLDPGAFDVVNIRHVLAHNTRSDQRRVVQHAFDLLKPGGCLYVVDVDITTGRYDPPDPDLLDLNDAYTRHLVDTGRHPTVGPVLGSLVTEHGFELVDRHAYITIPPVEALRDIRPPSWAARDAMLASGHATAADVERWDRALTRFQAHPSPAVFMPTFAVLARKPSPA